MGFMLDVIFKQIAICGGTLQHFCSNLLKAHPSSNKIVITLHPCSSHLPQSKEVLKCWQSETLRGYTALLQHNRKSAQSPEWNVSICLQQASIKTSVASAVSNAVGDLQSFNPYFSTQERQDSRCLGSRMPCGHPEHKLPIQSTLLASDRVTLRHEHREAHGFSGSHCLRKLHAQHGHKQRLALRNYWRESHPADVCLVTCYWKRPLI